ncbi:citrate/2-methylcitrate synthase [Escherichia coli]
MKVFCCTAVSPIKITHGTDSNYLEVCYILLNGEKPTQEQYDEFKSSGNRHTMIPQQITVCSTLSVATHIPMAVMCGITRRAGSIHN